MKYLVLVLLVFGFLNIAQASDSGCGAGGYIIQKNSKILQLLAVTTNHSFLSQEFGITSGTSGCTASGIVMNDRAAEYFAEVNREDLTREMSEGRGEKLDAFASLYGCNQQGQKEFATMTQSNFSQIVSQPELSAHDLVKNVSDELASHPEVAKLCSFKVATN